MLYVLGVITVEAGAGILVLVREAVQIGLRKGERMVKSRKRP